jgi:hypothetical protein
MGNTGILEGWVNTPTKKRVIMIAGKGRQVVA